ncbi:2-iminobutanoate/2-iminopropanoate deaminase [Merluccius polli]|uniref:2-iminobutanoate/2-iminopropanoate deaminase n=1 Tax=Merluccius polli TaxID=89951 RepID=A0AA47MTS0_MERPO|nr:2-iminobutanoate/2-iminopropanoate deaminase [Merluccius polli]
MTSSQHAHGLCVDSGLRLSPRPGPRVRCWVRGWRVRQAVVVDRTMYISGQLGLDTASGQLVEGGVQAQAKQALVNMGEILKAAGCDYGNVVKTTVLLADINDFNGVNEVYKTCESETQRTDYDHTSQDRGVN